MAIILYGIKNCDTIKKARRWLEDHQINYRFHDYRVDGLEGQRLQSFIDRMGWQPLLNTRGTTWRKLEEAYRNTINNEATAKAVMLEQPALIKRPLLVADDGKTLLGFSDDSYQHFFTENTSHVLPGN
ncbi:Regulatory protein Spx [Dickeya dianthicola]|uniref:ArsC family reductase n=1 Tax=Dickeya dianthicola TaxID=204039 RepID=A0AAP2CYB7_9GAMM|nr:ArsC family reductase [Dickeya dianthicola]ATO32160.1 a glutathione-dependent thio reductase [Dickeya dianthicola RNS04.9]AYC18160.1 Regulatory protein Spx [Dickeya dianthicola]MBI0437464.1 ArsC family reductase [Dickeya dianthicola]MBI0448707.1 ArsC family reductase [Dickeya dianthicola]MBI0453291.1 ArsC family reductase [Dickeya dianthicola]